MAHFSYKSILCYLGWPVLRRGFLSLFNKKPLVQQQIAEPVCGQEGERKNISKLYSNTGGELRNISNTDDTIEDWGRGCFCIKHNSEESQQSAKEFFDYLASLGREPSTKTNFANSSS